MRTLRRVHFLGLLLGATVALSAVPAHAHIDLDLGGTHMSRVSGSSLKSAPCGSGDSTRGEQVYTYRPGATITLSITETIPHPGYFRVAFDDDGADDFAIPTGTDGANGNCGDDPACGPGLDDYCNNDTVLLDNIDPHTASGFNTKRTWSVTLPDIECDNCTLQVIQMMNDFNLHPEPYPADDIYYHCIDLVLSNDADEVTDEPVETDAIVCGGGATGTPDAGMASDDGGDSGCSVGGAASAGGNALWLLAALWWMRRRRI